MVVVSIGDNLIRYLLNSNYKVLNLDKLTYAADKKSLKFFNKQKIINLAAESHVDRSIESSKQLIKSNIIGTTRFTSRVIRNFIEKNQIKIFISSWQYQSGLW